jgi:general stress protein 26
MQRVQGGAKDVPDRFVVVQQFVESLKAVNGDAARPRVDLLAENVTFQGWLTKVEGRDAVVQHLAGPQADKVYRQVTWSSPRVNREAVQIDGLMPPGSPVGGVILLCYVADGAITLIQHQSIAGAPQQATELKLTPELMDLVNNALASRHPILAAVVLPNGQPILSYRGSAHAFSDTQLAFWARHSDGSSVTAIANNPRVTLLYRDPDTRTTLQFQGRARVVDDSALRDKIYEGAPEPERNADFARLGSAVLVDLDRVEGSFPGAPGGRVLMVRGAS